MNNNSKHRLKFYKLKLTLAALVLVMLGNNPTAEAEQDAPSATLMHIKGEQAKGSSAALVHTEQQTKKLAIIIDDLGNNMVGTEQIMAMPIKLTVAVMPFLPSTEKDARLAHEKGFDVLLHLPMEPKQGRASWLGPGAILSTLTDTEVRSRVEKAIDAVPFAVGINNHMGSKITADERIMSIVLDVCKERGLFFVDSKTNYRSIVGKLCEAKGLPHIDNHIFLDDVSSEAHIAKQIDQVSDYLKTHESCVTIGHVGTSGKKTASVLRQSVDRLKKEAQFVGVSDLAQEQMNPNMTLP